MNHYERLGIERGVSDEELRRAYRRLASKLHPDRHPNDAEAATRRMVLLNEAYETLRDPVRRFDYNRSLESVAESRRTEEAPSPPERSGGAEAKTSQRARATPPDDPERRARREAKEKAVAEAAARGYRDPGAGRMNFKAPG